MKPSRGFVPTANHHRKISVPNPHFTYNLPTFASLYIELNKDIAKETSLKLTVHTIYLKSVLELHHAAVEEGGGQLWRDIQNFDNSVTGVSWNRVACSKQDVVCVDQPLWLCSKRLLLTQVEFGRYCMRRVIENFYRDPRRLTYLYWGENKDCIETARAIQKKCTLSENDLPCFTPIFSEVTFIVIFSEPKNEILVAYCCSYQTKTYRQSGREHLWRPPR